MTGVDFATGDGDPARAMAQIGGLQGSMVRLLLRWDGIAPATKPASFDARNPADPAYDWADVDAEVLAAKDAGLEPVFSIVTAPSWASPASPAHTQDGPTTPSISAYANFVTAATKRYSGQFEGLPRVRYWEAWNEPNISFYLMPQYESGSPVSFVWYRKMLNAFTRVVHAAAPGNVAIAGALAPFTVREPGVDAMGPLLFLRGLLCVSAAGRPTCSTRVAFDALSIHPYTSGNATHRAANADDLSLGDLGKLRPLLAAADRAHHIVHARPLDTWVSEFSWDSKPPDSKGVPVGLEARWVSEALYQAWLHGFTHFLWFRLSDLPPSSPFQSGLYYRGKSFDRPKPAANAFRFPFVAYERADGTASYWGRVPGAARVTVRIEQAVGKDWRTVATNRSNANGIITGAIASPSRRGFLRAVAGAATSRPFSLTVPADYPVNPFGNT